MDCSILIDAMRDVQLKGKVESLSEYPIPSANITPHTLKNMAQRLLFLTLLQESVRV